MGIERLSLQIHRRPVTGHWPQFSRLSPLSLLLPRALLLFARARAIGLSNSSSPASWGTAPPAEDWLRSRPAGSVSDDLTIGGKEFCVDSSLASFGAFSGARHSFCVGSPRSGSPSPQSPDATRRSPLPPDSLPTAGVRRGAWSVERGALSPSHWLRFRPSGSVADDSTSSGDELFVNSGLASFCTFCGARHSSCVGSPLPPDSLTTDHYSCATGHSGFTRHCHPPSGI